MEVGGGGERREEEGRVIVSFSEGLVQHQTDKEPSTDVIITTELY